MTPRITQGRTRNHTKLSLCVLVLLYAWLGVGSQAKAAEKLVLTVTPPLFQLNMGPGEFWASSLKVVNTNPYDLTLYASVMNFEAQGETGQGKLTPVVQDDPETSDYLLAHWIEVSKEPIFVPKEKSAEIPFTVRIPQDATPGGHYAAILVGNQAFGENAEGLELKVSSMVSSLLFVRIEGEVVEGGTIREFFSDRTFYEKPEVTLTLRFENKGNVHVRPQGDIVIYNQWGKERGRIPVNQKTDFGNVLPKSTRKFTFEWQGESNFFEIGRYTANATLSYGNDAKQNIVEDTYFWIVPLKPVAVIVGGFILFSLFLAWSIRTYVRRTLAVYKPVSTRQAYPAEYVLQKRIDPIRENVIDLRDIKKVERLGFLRKYKLFSASFVVMVLGIIGITIFLQQALTKESSFVVVFRDEAKEPITVSPEQLIEKQLKSIEVLNGSGIPRAAANVALLLEKQGFQVKTVSNADQFTYKKTLIRYKPGKRLDGVKIDKILGGTSIFQEVELQSEDIVVVVGKE